MKRKIAFLLVVVFLLANGMGVTAQQYPDDGEMMPEHALDQKALEEEVAKKPFVQIWTYALSASPVFTINQGVATCSYSVSALSSVNQINVYTYLQRLNSGKLLWENEKSWSKSHYSNLAGGENKYTFTKTGNYRVKIVAYFYVKGSVVESIAQYSRELTR